MREGKCDRPGFGNTQSQFNGERTDFSKNSTLLIRYSNSINRGGVDVLVRRLQSSGSQPMGHDPTGVTYPIFYI